MKLFLNSVDLPEEVIKDFKIKCISDDISMRKKLSDMIIKEVSNEAKRDA